MAAEHTSEGKRKAKAGAPPTGAQSPGGGEDRPLLEGLSSACPFSGLTLLESSSLRAGEADAAALRTENGIPFGCPPLSLPLSLQGLLLWGADQEEADPQAKQASGRQLLLHLEHLPKMRE